MCHFAVYERKKRMSKHVLVIWVALTVSKISMTYHNKILFLTYQNSCRLPGICAMPYGRQAPSILWPWSPVHSDHAWENKDSHEVGFYKQSLEVYTCLSFTFHWSAIRHIIIPHCIGDWEMYFSCVPRNKRTVCIMVSTGCLWK